MRTNRIKLILLLVFANLVSYAEGVTLETFESISAAIKSKKNAVKMNRL